MVDNMTDWPARPYLADNTLHVCDWLELMQALPDGSVDMILTDMPYGTTACSWDTVIDLDLWWFEVKRVMKPRGAVVCTASQPFTSRLVSSNYEWFRYEWIWNKRKPGNIFNVQYMPLKIHENVLVFSKEPTAYYPEMSGIAQRPFGKTYPHKTDSLSGIITNRSFERGYPKSIINFMVPNNLTEGNYHPTQKPVALFEYLIKTYTQAGELVVDPFVGSGTTAVAAKITGRRFICGDQSAEYIEIARKRVFPTFGEPPKRKREVKPITDLPLFASLE